MESFRKYCLFILLLSGLMIQFLSCSSKKEWTTDSDNAYEYFLQGREYQNSFNTQKSFIAFTKSVQADSNFAIAALFLANAYYKAGNIDSARYFLNKAVKLSSNSSRFEQLIINQTNKKYRMDNDAADKIEDSLIVEFPDRFDTKIFRAGDAFKEERYKESREIYFDVLEKHPGYLMGYNMIAYSYMMQGYYRDALDYFQKYLKYASNILNPYDSMAEFYIITGKYNETLKILIDLISDKKELLDQNKFMSAVIYLKIADSYRYLGQYEKALEYSEIAKNEHQPVHEIHQINNFRFLLFKEMENIEGMKSELLRLEDRISKYELTYLGIMLDITENNYLSAEKRINDFCSKIVNKDKNFIRFFSILEGELAFARERYAVAADKFKTASEIRTNMYPAKIKNRYYVSLGLDGKYKEAINGLMQILDKNPNNPTSLYYVSQFYFELNDLQKAENYLQHFLNLWSEADENAPLLIKAKKLQNEIKQSY